MGAAMFFTGGLSLAVLNWTCVTLSRQTVFTVVSHIQPADTPIPLFKAIVHSAKSGNSDMSNLEIGISGFRASVSSSCSNKSYYFQALTQTFGCWLTSLSCMHNDYSTRFSYRWVRFPAVQVWQQAMAKACRAGIILFCVSISLLNVCIG